MEKVLEICTTTQHIVKIVLTPNILLINFCKISCYVFFFIIIKMYWQENIFFKVLLIVKGLILRALFQMAEVTVSRVYAVFGSIASW